MFDDNFDYDPCEIEDEFDIDLEWLDAPDIPLDVQQTYEQTIAADDSPF